MSGDKGVEFGEKEKREFPGQEFAHPIPFLRAEESLLFQSIQSRNKISVLQPEVTAEVKEMLVTRLENSLCLSTGA